MSSPHIHVEVSGTGPQVFVCAGLTQTTANWRGIARQNPHIQWVLFDPRGQGKSELGGRPYHLDDHVDDLMRVWAEYGNGQAATLMGFSHGGRVALRAVAGPEQPFRRLVLVSCASRATPLRRAHVMSWSKCLDLGGVEALAWASLPTIVGLSILRKFHDLDMLVKGTAVRNSREGLQAMFEGMSGYPEIEPDARAVHIPTLVFRGGLDVLVPETDGSDFLAWIRQCQVRTFPQSGHTLPLEEPEEFARILGQFVDADERPA